ncbi:MAG: glutathione S-transferase N-terminal domain-containing protein [Gammaproteobacteria bacterium]|nr:glutathione S-transferase N-terminal domain-containing protein [Gammaproteobacteria bacterium]
MAVVANRRSVMTLFSDNTDMESHRVRIVLAEKGINFEVVDVKPDDRPEDLIDLNPYNSVPTLVDRDLVLFSPQVIMEYLDERFPHPPLMPVDPVSRAQMRLMLYRVKRDWDTLAEAIQAGGKDADEARKSLRENLTAVSPIFETKPFFMSDEFSLVDCMISALVWRLPVLGVDIPAQAKGLLAYAERMFEREAFKESLTEMEKEMR